ncbi:hypothetical protein L2E82_17405 [Cichorium intybus]|uniref:Uncharacterized protein n=2 Tax=Cichorium intybus TaxID=13427 RepID=A0ACB9F8U3_CICIN|nr:hypothetical protein L2E82_17403 [Cichorium intybus]KAI3767310.1 hypothetical protein L2E82_17405 [Cichorium intybus]
MIGNLVRFGRRQLHTVVSREIIKPSSPTPSHLKTHNLSLIDQVNANLFMPMVTFYPNTGICRDKTTLDLKNSLSQTLTKYYPFAGRHAKVAPSYVDCNDNGAEFLVASIECGGLAVAWSLSHKVADGSSLFHFMKDWAKMNRFLSTEPKHEFSNDPKFIHFEYMNINSRGLDLEISDDCVTRSFMFPSSKIKELKQKVKAMTTESGKPITNPTRVENECEMNPESFISELRNQKTQFQAIRNIETAMGIFSEWDLEELLRKFTGLYICSSLCGNSAYEIDFGWGKPVKATHAGDLRKNSFILMDAPNGDGIEALVCLGNQDMAIVQNDPELLAFG